MGDVSGFLGHQSKLEARNRRGFKGRFAFSIFQALVPIPRHMNLNGNTVLITGGGSGIGQGLAHALHQRGSKVIIAGRRRRQLDETLRANPGMEAVELDITDAGSIAAFAQSLVSKYPSLNVLVNNAGIMRTDDVSGAVSEEDLISTISTNLLGPIRLTSALIGHLKRQPAAAVINVTSGLAFTPKATSAVYSATKAALHSYSLSLRYQLKNSPVRVLELAPPWVQTDLTPGQKTEPRAMPLADYLREAIALLETDSDEILVERVRPQRNNAGPNEHAFVDTFNDRFKG